MDEPGPKVNFINKEATFHSSQYEKRVNMNQSNKLNEETKLRIGAIETKMDEIQDRLSQLEQAARDQVIRNMETEIKLEKHSKVVQRVVDKERAAEEAMIKSELESTESKKSLETKQQTEPVGRSDNEPQSTLFEKFPNIQTIYEALGHKRSRSNGKFTIELKDGHTTLPHLNS
jgi:hypothetical protein